MVFYCAKWMQQFIQIIQNYHEFHPVCCFFRHVQSPKMLEQLLSHLKKKTIRQEATLRIEEEHGNLKGYDSTTTKLPVELTPLVFRKWPKGNKNSTRIKMNLDNHVSRWTFCLFPWYVCPFFFRDTLVITCNYHLNISKRFLPGIVDGNTRPTSPSFFHSNELAQLVLTLE